MFGKRLLVSAIIAFYYLPHILSAEDVENSCVGLKTCAICTQNPECAWCSQSDFHGSDKKPLPRCNTINFHKQQGNFRCDPTKLFNHSTSVKVIRNDELSNGNEQSKAVHIKPQHLHLKMRVKDPVVFDMYFKEVEDYPLELYYLMDGTYSMKDDKEVLENLGDAIGERLRTLTSKYRQGFGTFVDKVTMPYASSIPALLENPCQTSRENYTCVKPYSFKNHMKLSNNTKEFSNSVKAITLSASNDFPEGGLDALMQVMVCGEQIGWSEQTRRLIIFASDGTFHYAGDGRLGGIYLPNDGNCHLDEKGEYYTHSLVSDYPSMAQINAKAKQHSINIIFAVTSGTLTDYQTLSKVIEGSATTELAQNSSNIVDLVEDQYKRITAKVEINDDFPSEYFRVKYFSKCYDNGVETERDTCENIQASTVIKFRIEIELIKCPPTKEEWEKAYRIYAVGLPDGITLDVKTLCDCPCEDPSNGIPNSRLCNGQGTESCGLCTCNPNHFGEFCECSSNAKTHVDESTACKLGNSSETCSGRGNCICRQCDCINKQRYSGRYCECDNESCDRANELLCAGHGTCDCGNCKCDPGWEGSNCACSTNTDYCFAFESEEECSGQGTCKCGKCECNKHFGGEYCEKCLDDSCKRCEELKHCVQCKLFSTGIYNPADCELKCFQHNIKTVDVVSNVATDEVFCRAEDHSDECVFIFKYRTSVEKGLTIKAQRTKECPPKAPIFMIIAIVSSLVVLIGLFLVCGWRIYRNYKIKKEYAAFKKEGENVVWGQQTNPIYNNPIGVFNNPTYMGNDK